MIEFFSYMGLKEKLLSHYQNNEDSSEVRERQKIIIEEQDLMRMAQNGRSDAFGRLYERYLPKIYGYAYHKVGRHELAEDIAANTFIRAFKNLSKYTPRENISPIAWFFRIAHNDLANWYRDNHRSNDSLSFEDTPSALINKPADNSPEESAEKREERNRVINALSKLKSRRMGQDQYEVLVLKYGYDMSDKEIAEAIEKTYGATKALAHRGLVNLRTIIKEENGD
ncbi:MAG: RNA polymerase sigma factor [bacterium]|nr:RNA polymerase sigma factor [bacterium]